MATDEIPPDHDSQTIYRCPRCDSVVPPGATRCVMCGLEQAQRVFESPDSSSVVTEESVSHVQAQAPERVPEPVPQPQDRQAFERLAEEATFPPVVKSQVREKRSQVVFWLVTAVVVLGLGGTWIALRENAPAVMAALMPTPSPLPLDPTRTPTPSATPSPSPDPTMAPTDTPPPEPTATPRDPRGHTVAAGETLFGLSLLYRVSAESIAAANGFDVGAPIQSDQTLIIPWPTATPPLESILFELNGEPVVADVTDCEIITIQSGDSAYALSANRGVPLEAIIAVNRQTMESIQLLQPGDTLCIPRIVLADSLPPTPGPSPTPLPTALPQGPNLLYPVDSAAIDVPSPLLQWVAVKNLEENEWYMVEMLDLDGGQLLPLRGFTRDTSYRVPSEWRPEVAEARAMRWLVSIVQVNGRRSDGQFTYSFGGDASAPGYFVWQGAVPTPTVTPSPTVTPEPSSN